MNFRRLALSSAVFFLSAAAWTGASRAAFEGDLASPHRIVLTLTADPAHSQAVTWRAAAKAARPRAQIAVASANPSFGRAAVTTAGKATGVDSAGTTGTYAAVFLGLNPDTAYSYRVGDGDWWSEWNLFHTASEKADPFSFLYFGDAQNNIASLWSQVVRSAVFRNPQARFLVHAGDLVSEGHDERLWDEWTAALGFLASMIPSLPVPGNHDLHRPGRDTLSAPLPWNRIFRPPENGPEAPELRGQSYYVDYQGVRLIALDVNVFANGDFTAAPNAPIAAAQLAWLERLFSSNPHRWTIVAQHQPIYSVTRGRNHSRMREVLLPLYDKYGVDLVLQGHDHAYARTHKLVGGMIVGEKERGTVYVVSVSGPKMYSKNTRFEGLMAKVIESRQMYQVIEVASDRIRMLAYDATGELQDEVVLRKPPDAKH